MRPTLQVRMQAEGTLAVSCCWPPTVSAKLQAAGNCKTEMCTEADGLMICVAPQEWASLALNCRSLVLMSLLHAAAALEALHIPRGTIRVIFKTLNTKK